MSCENHMFKYVKYKMINGEHQLRKQCVKCTHLEGRAYSQNGFDMSKIQDAKPDDSLMFELEKVFAQKTEMRKRRFEQLNQYYNSPAWKVKRQKVLARDSHLCQSCLENRATELHHLTYECLQQERLFTLVSVCKPCHDSITKMDRDNRIRKPV